jgi:hypothetical protein
LAADSMTSRIKQTALPQRRRQGAIAVIALIALLVASMIGATLVKMTLAHARQIRTEEVRLQCGWLVQSGLDRAEARLAGQPGYTGETWDVPAAELAGPAQVQITVEPVENESSRRSVTVVAVYPVQATLRARLSRRYLVSLSPVGTSGSDPATNGDNLP